MPKLIEGRYPGTQQIMQWFAYDHLPEGLARGTSHACYDMALDMVASLNDGPELTAGLRKLLEAKDCFVRQAILDSKGGE